MARRAALAGAARGGEVHPRRDGRGRAFAQALRARGARAVEAVAPAHRARVRVRLARGPALPGDGVRRGRQPHRAHRRGDRARRPLRAARGDAGRGRARLPAPRGHRAPRHQAGEHPADRDRGREAGRLRARAARGRPHGDDAGAAARHAALRRARGAAGQRSVARERPVRAGRGAVPAARAAAAVAVERRHRRADRAARQRARGPAGPLSRRPPPHADRAGEPAPDPRRGAPAGGRGGGQAHAGRADRAELRQAQDAVVGRRFEKHRNAAGDLGGLVAAPGAAHLAGGDARALDRGGASRSRWPRSPRCGSGPAASRCTTSPTARARRWCGSR